MLITSEHFTSSSPRGFIAIEGVNGAGKSTFQKKLVNYLRERDQQVLSTFEPGDSATGKIIRSLLLNTEPPLENLTELFLFAADRTEHVSKVILPALDNGTRVVTDRYLFSTIAFQGYGRKLPRELVTSVNHAAVQGLLPDLTFLLDLDPEAGLGRTANRDTSASANERDSFEEESLAFHTSIREGFLSLAEESEAPFFILDASDSPEVVFEKSTSMVDAWLASLS